MPSLRQLAKELGVSASYLSQVECGNRLASAKLQGAIDSYRQSVKQFRRQSGRISRSVVLGEVLELADRHGLGPCAARRGSSSLPFPIELPIARAPEQSLPLGSLQSLFEIAASESGTGVPPAKVDRDRRVFTSGFALLLCYNVFAGGIGTSGEEQTPGFT